MSAHIGFRKWWICIKSFKLVHTKTSKSITGNHFQPRFMLFVDKGPERQCENSGCAVTLAVLCVGHLCPEAPCRISGSHRRARERERDLHTEAYKSVRSGLCLQLHVRLTHTHTPIPVLPGCEQFKCADDTQLIKHLWPQWICAAHLLLRSDAPPAPETTTPQLQHPSSYSTFRRSAWQKKRSSEWADVEQPWLGVMGMYFNWLF